MKRSRKWPEMGEDKRIKAISRYANMLTYSTDILLVAFEIRIR